MRRMRFGQGNQQDQSDSIGKSGSRQYAEHLSMRDLSILTFVTLDGVMQGPVQPDEDTSGGFKRSGWCAPFMEEVMAQVNKEAMSEPFDLLFGRKTYDVFAGHWPNVDDKDPHAETLNKAKKYVATSRVDGLTWQNSEALLGNISEEVRQLKAQGGPLLQVHGSWQLIQTLLTHDLIDQFRLWTFPVVVGPGKRLFGDGALPSSLKLIKSQATSNGVVMSLYQRLHAPQ